MGRRDVETPLLSINVCKIQSIDFSARDLIDCHLGIFYSETTMNLSLKEHKILHAISGIHSCRSSLFLLSLSVGICGSNGFNLHWPTNLQFLLFGFLT